MNTKSHNGMQKLHYAFLRSAVKQRIQLHLSVQYVTISATPVWEEEDMLRQLLQRFAKSKEKSPGRTNLPINSALSRILAEYNSLDEYIHKSQTLLAAQTMQPFCRECGECCKEYFYISEIEFFMIAHYLICYCEDWELSQIILAAQALVSKLALQYPAEFKKITTPPKSTDELFEDKNHLTTFETCPLRRKGHCTVYPNRPLTCMTFGVFKEYPDQCLHESAKPNDCLVPMNCIGAKWDYMLKLASYFEYEQRAYFFNARPIFFWIADRLNMIQQGEDKRFQSAAYDCASDFFNKMAHGEI